MAHFRIKSKFDLVSVTTQEFKTLHETLDEYLRTGVLDTPSSDSSYDFDSADEVDFDKPVPHDVDIYDAACGHDNPFLGVAPLAADPATGDSQANAPVASDPPTVVNE